MQGDGRPVNAITLGYSSYSSTMDTYAHACADALREAAAAIDRALAPQDSALPVRDPAV